MEILVKNLTAGYSKEYPAIKMDEFHILDSDKIILIEGKNSSGKSTFLKSLVNGVPYFSGEVYFDGVMFEKNRREKILDDIGFCLIPGFTLEKFSLLENYNLYKLIYSNYSENFLEELVEIFQFGSFLNQKISSLSIGKRKLADIILSLLNKPRLIIWDEPTTNLDDETIQVLIRNITFLSEKYPMQFIIATNEGNHFYELPCKNVLIKNGEIINNGNNEY